MRNILVYVFILISVGVTFYYFSPTKIEQIYVNNHDHRAVIANISNPPKNIDSAISWWIENKDIFSHYFNGESIGKYILFSKNKFEKESKEENAQICIPSRRQSVNNCINLDDRLFFVTRKDKGYWMGFYDYYSDNSCNVFIHDSGDIEFINCQK